MALQELSDGLERSIKPEGADIAPESPDGLEDQEKWCRLRDYKSRDFLMISMVGCPTWTLYHPYMFQRLIFGVSHVSAISFKPAMASAAIFERATSRV